MFRIHSLISHVKPVHQIRTRRALFECLERRELLALAVLEETFKNVKFTVTGEYSGSSSSLVAGKLYTDQYTGVVTSGTGEIQYTSPTNGNGTITLAGSGSGQEHYDTLSSNYTLAYTGSMSILDTGGAIATAHNETFITRDGTLVNNLGGGTPLDSINAGALSVAVVPYTITTGRSINIPQPFSRNAGQFSGQLTPVDSDANPSPYDLSVSATFHNGYYDVFLSADGPAQAAATRTTAIGQVAVYFATGPNIGDIVPGVAPLATHPIYWNTNTAMLRVQPTATVANNWTHLVVVADPDQVLTEANEANNTWSLPILKPKSLAIYDFTATVQSMLPDRFGELPTMANGTQFSGRFHYDQTTGQIGHVELTIPGLPQRPTEQFSQSTHSSTPSGAIDRASLNYSTNIAGWQNSRVDTAFEFEGLFPNGFPASLLGLAGDVTISSPNVQNGFAITALINTLTPVTNYAPFQNPAGRYFVNMGDSTTAAQDYALIVNRFNVTGPVSLDPPLGPIDEFWDVDGNNFLSLTDAAIILAIVNAEAEQGEPTSEPAQTRFEAVNDVSTVDRTKTIAESVATLASLWLPDTLVSPGDSPLVERDVQLPTTLPLPARQPLYLAAQLWAWRFWQQAEQLDEASSASANEEQETRDSLFADDEPFWQEAFA